MRRCPPLLLVLLTCPPSGCADRAAPAPGPLRDAGPALIQVRAGTGLLFSFFDLRAELRTVEQPGKVMESARAEVLVTDPRHPLPGEQVYLADLRAPGKGGLFKVWIDRRGAWLDRVMPRLSRLPGAVAAAPSPPPKKAKLRRPRRRPRPSATAAVAAAPQPRVVLFSTSWCPSCKAARAHLTGRGVRFVELDVENDPQAGAYYQRIQTTHGLKPGAVPLIVVDGRPVQGFSAPQLDALLAAAGLVNRGL